jgi:hypothetical protein
MHLLKENLVELGNQHLYLYHKWILQFKKEQEELLLVIQ